MPEGSTKEESVHLSQFPDDIETGFDQNLVDKWDEIIQLRSEVSKALEISRERKIIGHSLDAKVKIVLPDNLKLSLEEEELRYIFIVSSVEFTSKIMGSEVFESEAFPGLKIFVSLAPGQKCERCWNYFSGQENKDVTVCPRCTENLEAAKA